jgi:hypothetical protein
MASDDMIEGPHMKSWNVPIVLEVFNEFCQQLIALIKVVEVIKMLLYFVVLLIVLCEKYGACT